MAVYDLVVKGGLVVIPGVGAQVADVAIREGRFAAIADEIPPAMAEQVLDASGKFVFPGAVDSHFHVGIYRPLDLDARSESASALKGGVTTIISYFRTGHYYLNKTGPYSQIFPEVLSLSSGNFYTDYAYHLAPMTASHLDEISGLAESGVSSFKYYMFYKTLTLAADAVAGARETGNEAYDLGHLYEIMDRVADLNRRQPGLRYSVSVHCENPEIIRVFIERVKRMGIDGLEAYHLARPPFGEHLAIIEAAAIARATGSPMNVLHLSSSEALETVKAIRLQWPELDVVAETTLHHLGLTYEKAGGILGKVNPPIRTQRDADALWEGIRAGHIQSVASDHACCSREDKGTELWSAVPGFGGTALLYPLLISEGHFKRGISLDKLVQTVTANPARIFGLYPQKGTIAVGSDADLAIMDPSITFTVQASGLDSAQDFTPFQGMQLRGQITHTILRGRVAMGPDGRRGEPQGSFLARPIVRA
jgi:dihydroorotase-like cyclic amidohydrolase